jgi:lipopolysaccharide transport protein LptA
MKELTGGSRGYPFGLAVRAGVWLVLLTLSICTESVGLESTSGTRIQPRFENPIRIKADRLEYRGLENTTIYIGDVVAEQNEYRLTCQRLEVHWNPQSKKISQIIARGEVKLDTEEGVATSEVGLLNVKSKEIVLTGSPRFDSGEKIVEGQRIIYSISESKSTVLGDGKGKRVKSRLLPKGKRP